MLFKKNVLSSSVAVALVGSTMPSFSQAQELEIEEVIVEGGIRASLKKSMDLKRDTVGVADAISAEDMGKFPDSNLAEALQRITGVSIDRSRGEGSKVTVRGFGPDYNLVTLNGRQMPTHAGTSRSFDFGDLASEGISAVVVNKTGDASAPSGGIGSLINIVSTKPLEAGYVRSFGAKAVYDTSVIATGDIASNLTDITDVFNFDREGISPEFAGIISDTFADDTLGVSLSFSAQERNNAARSAGVGGWRTHLAAIDPDVLAIMSMPYDNPNDDLQNNNRPMPNAVFSEADPRQETLSIPQSVNYRLTEFVSERINGQLTIQHRPIDALTTTVDYTYSTVDYTRNYNDLSAWFSGQGAVSQEADWHFGPNNPNGTPKLYNEISQNSDIAMGLGRDGAVTENNSVGLNLEWYATDRLQLEFDYHNSSAESGAKDKYGTSSLVTIASLNRCSSTAIFTEDFPILVLGMNPEDCRSPLENGLPEGWEDRPIYKDDMVITGSVFHNGRNKMVIDQAEISGKFDATDYSSIDFGIEYTEATNRTRSSLVQRDSWSTPVSQPGDISHILERVTTDGYFDSIEGGDYQYLHNESFKADFNELTAIASSYPEQDSATVSGDCDQDGVQDGSVEEGNRNFYCATLDWSVDKTTTEETKAAYVQLVHDNEVAGLPLNIRAGLRYEETVVNSEALVPVYDRTSWSGGNEFSLVSKKNPDGSNVTELVVDSGEYELLLPNLDLNLEIMDELVARASVSKTVTRPDFEAIKGGTTANSTIYSLSGHGASRGDPGLLPIESINFDLSLEWYYGDTDYLSLGYFKKDVDNFIGRSSNTQNLWNLLDVSRGGIYEETWKNIPGADRSDLSDIAAARNVDSNSPLLSCSDTDIQNGLCTIKNDPLPFQVSFPINEKNAKVYGLEFNVQHNFGDSGYGVILNYTKPWSDVAYDPIVTTKECEYATPEEAAEADADAVCLVEQFALSGLSESANLIAFYDKDGMSLRFAYNWRDDFFGGNGQDQGAVYDSKGRTIGANPSYTAAYGQLDMSASYEVNDNLTLFMDGLNITDSYNRGYGREEMQVLGVTQTGPRYTLGFRYSL
ncbi:MAG: TonB-dependent receptor [Porticoccaceae bacterium]